VLGFGELDHANDTIIRLRSSQGALSATQPECIEGNRAVECVYEVGGTLLVRDGELRASGGLGETGVKGLAVEGADRAVHRPEERGRASILEGHVGATRDKIGGHARSAAGEILNGDGLSVPSDGLVVGDGAGVLDEAGTPLFEGVLLDGGSIKLSGHRKDQHVSQ
jgi:hypothetical protein